MNTNLNIGTFSAKKLKETYEIIQIWQSTSAISTTLEVPKSGGGTVSSTKYQINLDGYEGGIDAIALKMSGGYPIDEVAETSTGDIVTCTLSGADNRTCTLSATPSAYPVAIVFEILIQAQYVNEIDSDYIVERFPVLNSWDKGGNTLVNIEYIGSLNNFPIQIGANSLVHLEFQTTNAMKYLAGQYWYPSSDSTTAFQLRRADGSTVDFNYDSTNGRIGIGTTALDAKLHVVQSTDGGGGIKLYGYDTGADGYGHLYIETGNNGKQLTINSLYGTNYRVGGVLLAQFLSGVMNIYGNSSQPTNRLGFSQQFSLGYNWTDSKLYLANYNQSTKYMTVDTSGNIGIGTNSPASKLHIDFGNATAGSMQLTNGTTTGQTSADGFHVGLDTNGNAIINQKENLYLALYTNNTERLRYLAGGGTSERTGTYKYLDASPTADTVNDIRISNISGTFTVEKCTVANATKGAGTWVTILTA